MVKSSLCRICLVENLRMYCIHNTNLQETYERLTGLPLLTEDSRPLQVCYICCAKLRNSYNLQTACLETEELLTEMLVNNKLHPIKSATKLCVEPTLNWSNVCISPEDVPVDIIIDDDDDDVVFFDDNHNLDVDVKVENMEVNIEHIANKHTVPNDTTSFDSTLEDDIEIKCENTPVIDLSTDSNICVTDTHTETDNNRHFYLAKHNGKADTGHKRSFNSLRLRKNTAKYNIIKPTNIRKRRASYDSRLDISIVKGDFVEELVNIDYTEPFEPKIDVSNATDMKTNTSITKQKRHKSNNTNFFDDTVVDNITTPPSVRNAKTEKEDNLFEKETDSSKVNVKQVIEIIENVDPNNTPIPEWNAAFDAIMLDSVKSAGSNYVSVEEKNNLDNEINTAYLYKNDSAKNIQQVIKHAEPNITESSKADNLFKKKYVLTEINHSSEYNIKQVFGIENTGSHMTPIIDVNNTADVNTIITCPIKLARVQNEVSRSEENTIESEIINYQNNCDKNIRPLIKTKSAEIINTSIFNGDTRTDTATIVRLENNDSRERNTIENKMNFVSNPNNSNIHMRQVIETKHVKSNINPTNDVRNAISDTTMIGENIRQEIGIHAVTPSVTTKQARAENEVSRKNESYIRGDKNSSVKNIGEVIDFIDAEPINTPIIELNNSEADNLITRVEKEISSTEYNSIKNNPLYMLMHVALNSVSNINSFRENKEQFTENTYESNTTPIDKDNTVVTDSTTQNSCENVETLKEINSLNVNLVEHKISDEITPIIEIKHAESCINSVYDGKKDVDNTTIRCKADNEFSVKKINSLKESSLENDLSFMSNSNKFGKNTRPVIEIKHIEQNINSILETDTTGTVMLSRVENEDSIIKDNSFKANSLEHEISKKIRQVIEIKHIEQHVTPMFNNATSEDTTQTRKVISLENNSSEYIQINSNKNNNQKVICMKHVEKNYRKLNVEDFNNQNTVINDSKVNINIYDINKDENHIVQQGVNMDYKKIENSKSDIQIKANNIIETFNEYAVNSDIFRCDDINAVEGNFLGQEVVIDSSEGIEIPIDVIDTNNLNQEDINKDITNNEDVTVNDNINHKIDLECPLNNAHTNKDNTNQVLHTECTINKTILSNDVNSIRHITEQDVTIDYSDIKNVPKMDEDNIIDKNIENFDNKLNISIENGDIEIVGINVEDEIEEKYNIETEFCDKNEINKKNCLEKDSHSTGVFCQDVMVVLHKLELNDKCENRNLEVENKEIRKRDHEVEDEEIRKRDHEVENKEIRKRDHEVENKEKRKRDQEVENKEIRKRDHWRRRSSRKRNSSVLKESPQIGNTRKHIKKIKFKQIHEKNNKDVDIKPFICDICQKSFILKHHLIEHNRKHTGEKPYKCDICEKCFYYQNVLNNHVASHSGSRPHKCDICGKCYSLKVNLMRHKRVHTCEKPYKCDICEKCFGYKQHLTTHIRIHTGERPYQCELCPKRFNQRNNLNTHVRSMHTDIKFS